MSVCHRRERKCRFLFVSPYGLSLGFSSLPCLPFPACCLADEVLLFSPCSVLTPPPYSHTLLYPFFELDGWVYEFVPSFLISPLSSLCFGRRRRDLVGVFVCKRPVRGYFCMQLCDIDALSLSSPELFVFCRAFARCPPLLTCFLIFCVTSYFHLPLDGAFFLLISFFQIQIYPYSVVYYRLRCFLFSSLFSIWCDLVRPQRDIGL